MGQVSGNMANKSLQNPVSSPKNAVQQMGKWLVAAGALLALVGLLFWLGSKLPFLSKLGHLPGDIVIKRDNFRFYFPLATSILLSLLLSLILYLARKFL